MKVSVLLVALFGLLAPAVANAETNECISRPRSTEQRFADAALVFVADVLDAEWAQPYRVTFNVLEAYKGITVGKQTVVFIMTFDTFIFTADQRVFVIASPDTSGLPMDGDGARGRYDISSCTGTRRS